MKPPPNENWPEHFPRGSPKKTDSFAETLTMIGNFSHCCKTMYIPLAFALAAFFAGAERIEKIYSHVKRGTNLVLTCQGTKRHFSYMFTL